MPAPDAPEASAPQTPGPFPPFFTHQVAAGFPIPASDDAEGPLDLNKLCIKHPAASYFIRARGDSMIGAGIHDGDILVVDRALQVRNGDVIIASIDGEFTVKRFERTQDGIRLVPENPAYPAIEIGRDTASCEFFGVVTSTIHFFRHTV